MEVSRATKVVSHLIGVRKKADSQKEVRQAADSKKRVCEAKSLGTSGLTYNATVFSQLAIQYGAPFVHRSLHMF